MCLKCFSRRPLSFALGYQATNYYLHPFSKKITPKNEAGDSYKKYSYKKVYFMKNEPQ